jgi:hypothetical protein
MEFCDDCGFGQRTWTFLGKSSKRVYDYRVLEQLFCTELNYRIHRYVHMSVTIFQNVCNGILGIGTTESDILQGGFKIDKIWLYRNWYMYVMLQ